VKIVRIVFVSSSSLESIAAVDAISIILKRKYGHARKCIEHLSSGLEIAQRSNELLQ